MINLIIFLKKFFFYVLNFLLEMVDLWPSKKSRKGILYHSWSMSAWTSRPCLPHLPQTPIHCRPEETAPSSPEKSHCPTVERAPLLCPSCSRSLCLPMGLLAICSPPRSKSLLTFIFVFFCIGIKLPFERM